MTPPALAAALVAVAGAVVALSARDGRLAALGLLAALVAAPFTGTSLPESQGAAARLVGAALAAYLVWAFARDRDLGVHGAGSALGGAAELLVVAAAFSAGLQTTVVSPLAGSTAAQAAAFGILVPASVALLGADVFRAGLGAVLLALAASLLRDAWLGPAAPLEQLATTGLLVGIAAGACVLGRAAARMPQAERTAEGEASSSNGRSIEAGGAAGVGATAGGSVGGRSAAGASALHEPSR